MTLKLTSAKSSLASDRTNFFTKPLLTDDPDHDDDSAYNKHSRWRMLRTLTPIEIGLEAINELNQSRGIFFSANHFADRLFEHRCTMSSHAIYDVLMRELCPYVFFTDDLTHCPGLDFLRHGNAFKGIVGLRWETRNGRIGNIWYTSEQETTKKIEHLQ